MRDYLLFVFPTLYIFDVESFMVQNMEPRCSIPLPQAGFIKDIVWRKAAKYNFLVLTKDGKLFHGKFPDPSLTELMDGIDAVESSDIGDIVVAKQNNITVFSSDLNEKMIIPLSSELWLGVPMGGATNVGEPVDNYSDCKIKVDAIKWIVLNDDNTFSDCIVVGGYKYNEDGREEDYLLLVLKSKMGRILNPTSQLVAYSKFEFYWNLSGPFCIGPPGMGPYLIFNSFRNGYIVVLSNRKVVDNEIMLVSLKGIKSFAPYLGRDSKPIYFDIERDHFIPRINLQDYGYNQVMGICSEEDEEGYFVLFILLSGGKLKIYRMEDHRRIVPVFD
ncbi:nuclear pore complex protein NUP214-like isoform X2 [Gossypium arboreum]|uniref:nuclear pore complex protein NUP214-like isoform X2 n=1 Tax=Gossypium arboreum TaxID=29729 RepID=UPI0008193302|nr:nuclear pore complex protein NUP214-like isoform X2 [Gossypium arboreum]XP_052886477.1 nuclear pore complex protein NUP214-like isoform X2 [Gossypium arboreum]